MLNTFLSLARKWMAAVAVFFAFFGAGYCSEICPVDTFPVRGNRDSIQKTIKRHRYYIIKDWDIPYYIRKMERLYGVKFVITESMPNKSFTISRLEMQDPLEFYLELLQGMGIFNFVIEGKRILLYPSDY